jgi:hypothetical protein
MPKSIKFNESDLLKACEAAQAQKKLNISKIAREHGVPYQHYMTALKRADRLI